ncbi:MAG TPA: 4'-phosphopantetheinyl transferase superfamily protein [Bacteroidia bacterium]|nr:4'-phosphopantetheinyl transferase superfamily protein [Bacteroidia bacterium]
MPLILKIEDKNEQRSAVWEIQEDEFTLRDIACLNETDTASYSLLTNAGRRLEWLAVRALLKEFYPSPPTITYNEKGKPFLINHPDKISISHSGKMVALALNPDETPGIDIEMLHPRIIKIANRFLSEKEKMYLGANPSIEQLTVIWGAKEVMFKVYAHGGVTFNEELIVQPFQLSPQGALEGHIYKEDRCISVTMKYMRIKDFMMVQTNYPHKDFEKNL